MAYIARECVTCTDKTKKVAGEFHGKDEKGDSFTGKMYLCENCGCSVNRARIRAQKQMIAKHRSERQGVNRENHYE